MKWQVTQLQDHGRPMKGGEWPDPVEGELKLTVMPEEDARRPLKKMDLFGVPGTVRQALLLPLFDPQIISMDASSMVLHGMQLHSEDGGNFAHMQVWHCVPAAQPD